MSTTQVTKQAIKFAKSPKHFEGRILRGMIFSKPWAVYRYTLLGAPRPTDTDRLELWATENDSPWQCVWFGSKELPSLMETTIKHTYRYNRREA